MRAPAVDRLTPSDLAVLWPEDLGWPQDVGLLAILDGAGGLGLRELRSHVRSRLPALPPRFRKVLVRPRRGLGGPYWVDAPALDLGYHVRSVALPAGADERALLEACEAVRRRRFDPSRPRWHLTLFEGLAGGRVGLFMDAHHCLVDGIAGIVALGAFADVPEPFDAPELPPPRAAPTTGALLLNELLRALGRLRAASGALLHPRRSWRALSSDVLVWRRATRGGPTPATSLTATLGARRRYALVRSSLATCKTVARANDATVNDVLLCVLAGGLRALLSSRGEDPDGMTLRAAVPVSLHDDEGGSAAQGNRAGGLLLTLPVGEADTVSRLRRVARDSAARKRDAVLPGASSPFFSAAFVQRRVLRLTTGQRMSNSYVANVPGPPFALSLAGAPILEAFPLVPLVGNLTVGIGALSYAGQLAITVVADADACPDPGVLVAAMERDLETLARRCAAPAASG
jgi:diacylglycerol O-acyltransferase / wax synthase